MANRLFDAYKNAILDKDASGGNTPHALPDLLDGLIKVTLIDTADDDPNTTSDQDYADIAAAARVSVATLGTKTVGSVAAGVFDAADTTFSAVSGDQSEELLVWFDSTVESTSLLIAVFDTFASGMPVTPNGGDITVSWNASGIFAY